MGKILIYFDIWVNRCFHYPFVGKVKNMGFRENLKSELTYQDIRVKELASRTGISKRTLDHYLTENGSEPTALNAVLIASALGVSAEYLVTGKDSNVSSAIKQDVLEMIVELNHLSAEDFSLARKLILRLKSTLPRSAQ